MNRDLKYIYPISRVRSIEQLLRTTAHNAFLVVTPLKIDQRTVEKDKDKKPRRYLRKPIHCSTIIAQTREIHSLNVQEALSSANSSAISHEETVLCDTVKGKADEDTPLIFHGIVLRSQLVTLLSNKIFHHEDDSVSCLHCI